MSLLEAFLDEEPVVQARNEIWIGLRTDGVPGTGDKENPYDGSTAIKLDSVLANFAIAALNTTIHFGPGVFETKGGQGNFVESWGWLPLGGQRFIGAGMFQTTLKLVRPSGDEDLSRDANLTVIARLRDTFMDGYEVSDLTIDCNLGGLLSTPGLDYPRVGANAISFGGRNVRIRRVRVINFGTRTEKQECFPIIISTPQSGGMMNCIVVFGKLNCAQFARTKFCCEGVSLVWSRLSRSCPF